MKLDSSSTTLFLAGVQSNTVFDTRTNELKPNEFSIINSVVAFGSNVVGSLELKGSKSSIVLRDLLSGSVIKRVTLMLSPDDLKGASIKALSSDLRYAALVVNKDTIVVQDLIDTSRLLFDECYDCGSVSVDFISNNHELITIGPVIGGIWDLDSMKLRFYDPLLTMEPFSSQKFGFVRSGDVLLHPKSRRLAIFDRKSRAIRADRTFDTPVYNFAAIDDDAVVCEVKDSLLILDSTLSTISSMFVFPQHGTAITWNSAMRTLAVQLYQNDLLLMRYGSLTDVEDIYNLHRERKNKAFAESFVVEVPSLNAESIRVYSVSGLDLTSSGVNLTEDVNGIKVISNTLPSGAYTVVDLETGWTTVVMLIR